MDGGQSRVRQLATAFAAGVAVFGASLANFLSHNDYPIARIEVALLVATLVIIAGVMAVLHQGQRQWGRSLLEGLLTGLFVDLNLDVPVIAVVAGLAVALFTYVKQVSLIGPMAMIGTFLLLTTAIGRGGGRDWITDRKAPKYERDATNRPAILHLILDEHLGIEGFAGPDRETRDLRDALKSFYLRAGFTLYGGAYAEHMHTVNAIPHVLNYGNKLGRRTTSGGVTLGPAEHFRTLRRQGYALTVVQSDFTDLCGGNAVARCISYDSSSPRPTLDMPLSTADRARLIALKFASLSDLAKLVVRVSNRFAEATAIWPLRHLEMADAPRSSTVAAHEVFDRLNRMLRAAQPGEAYVAHLLTPHYPYLTRADCSYLPPSAWTYRHAPGTIEQRRRAYYDQVRCATRKVEAALAAFASAPGGKGGVVIVQGDHGSRLASIDPIEPNLEKVTDPDLVATFSTLLAIRSPSGSGYHPAYQPVAAIVGEFARSGFRVAPPSRPVARPMVQIDDVDWVPRRRIALPSSWANASDRPASKRLAAGQ